MAQNENNVLNWAMEPSFLSLRERKERYNVDGEFLSPHTDGLFYANELRGILADASAGIWDAEEEIGKGNIFALFQVVEEDFDPLTEDNCEKWFVAIPKDAYKNTTIIKKNLEGKKILRIHPGNLYPNLPCCEAFRKCDFEPGKPIFLIDEQGKTFNKTCAYRCFEIDSRIALFYEKELLKINYERYKDGYFEMLKEVIKDYNKELGIDERDYSLEIQDEDEEIGHFAIQIGENNSRPYIRYKCKYSKLYEYAFPVFHVGRVVAVLMHGQCVPVGLTPDEMFDSFRDIKIPIKKNQTETIGDIINKMSEEGFSDKVRRDKAYFIKISERIKKLEDKIQNAVNTISQNFVLQKSFKIEKKFREKITSKQVKLDDRGDELKYLRKEIKELDKQTEAYERNLCDTLHKIVEQFANEGFIRIYAVESRLENTFNQKKYAFKIIGNSNGDDSDILKKLIFEKDLFKEEINKNSTDCEKKVNEIGKDDLLKCMKDERELKPKIENEDIFRMIIPFTLQAAYIVWERYPQTFKNSTQYNKHYAPYLNLMLHTLLEPYFILKSMRLEKDLEASMRISGHESVQITPLIIQAINTPKTLEALATGGQCDEWVYKPAFVMIDTTQRLMLLEELFTRSSLIFRSKLPELQRKHQDFYRIIHSTESLFKDKAKEDNMQKIEISLKEDRYFGSLSGFYLQTNYGYLSHILFNLMSNAIKYGQRGSMIYVDVHLKYKQIGKTEFQKQIIIKVTNYGDEMENSDKIFELYYQSPKVKDGEGMGIGLFLAKKLCNFLGYEIKALESKKIAHYNLSAKYQYNKQKKSLPPQEICSNPETTLLILQSPIHQWEDKVVNQEDLSKAWKITIEGIEGKLSQPTYCNEFEITIPIEYGDLKSIKTTN